MLQKLGSVSQKKCGLTFNPVSIMKKIIILISVLTIFVFQACKKNDSPGDNFGFGESLPPYVTIRDFDDIEVSPSDTIRVALQLRTSLQQTVTATYKIEGAINVPSATVVFAKESKAATVKFAVPANVIVAPATSANAVLTLVKAQKEDGTALTIGQNVSAADQKVNIVIVP